MKKGC